MQVFISHSSQDQEIARWLAQKLRQQSLDVWIDCDRMTKGAAINDSFESALKSSEVILFLLTPESGKSKYLQKEWSAALEASWADPAKRLVPILISSAVLPPFLEEYQALRFKDLDEFHQLAPIRIKEAARAVKSGWDQAFQGARSPGKSKYQWYKRMLNIEDAAEGFRLSPAKLRGKADQFEGTLRSQREAGDRLGEARSLMNLATVFMELQDYEKSRRLLERSVEIFSSFYGDAHPSVAAVLTQLGLALRKQGRNERAQIVLERAMLANQKVLGEDHPAVAETMRNLGIVLMELGRLKEAKEVLQRALKANIRILGTSHPSALRVKSALNSLQRAS